MATPVGDLIGLLREGWSISRYRFFDLGVAHRGPAADQSAPARLHLPCGNTSLRKFSSDVREGHITQREVLNPTHLASAGFPGPV